VLDDPAEVVTVNGVFKAIALVKGRVAGTWTMPDGKVALALWETPDRATRLALQREAAAVDDYLSS
jgi:hypothetical protein